jgi:hypothetical protein
MFSACRPHTYSINYNIHLDPLKIYQFFFFFVEELGIDRCRLIINYLSLWSWKRVMA